MNDPHSMSDACLAVPAGSRISVGPFSQLTAIKFTTTMHGARTMIGARRSVSSAQGALKVPRVYLSNPGGRLPGCSITSALLFVPVYSRQRDLAVEGDIQLVRRQRYPSLSPVRLSRCPQCLSSNLIPVHQYLPLAWVNEVVRRKKTMHVPPRGSCLQLRQDTDTLIQPGAMAPKSM